MSSSSVDSTGLRSIGVGFDVGVFEFDMQTQMPHFVLRGMIQSAREFGSNLSDWAHGIPLPENPPVDPTTLVPLYGQ